MLKTSWTPLLDPEKYILVVQWTVLNSIEYYGLSFSFIFFLSMWQSWGVKFEQFYKHLNSKFWICWCGFFLLQFDFEIPRCFQKDGYPSKPNLRNVEWFGLLINEFLPSKRRSKIYKEYKPDKNKFPNII